MTVDPVSVGLLLAVAGGVGAAVGEQMWNGLSALVRRPFRHSSAVEATGSSGHDELVALQRDPADRAAAVLLAGVLQARAEADAGFRAALWDWQVQAQAAFPDSGNVHNEISGGTQHGPVLQGQNFSGITFSAAPSPPPSGNS